MIIFYSKEGCPWCDDARTFMVDKGLEFDEKEVWSSPEFYDEMVELSGQSKAPTFIIDGTVLADSSAEELEQYLQTQ
jgi:monothiol glutaredoxin